MIDIQKNGTEDIFRTIIRSLEEQSKIEILCDVDFITNKLNLRNGSYIAECISTIESEEEKLKLIDYYKLKPDTVEEIICTFSDESKIKIILENRYQLDKDDLIFLMIELDNELLFDLIANHKELLKKNNIRNI